MDFIDEAAMSEMMNALRLMTRGAYALQHLRMQASRRRRPKTGRNNSGNSICLRAGGSMAKSRRWRPS